MKNNKEKIKLKYYENNPKKTIPFHKQAYFHIHDAFFKFTKGWRTVNKEGYYRKDFWGYLENKLKELEQITSKQYENKIKQLEKEIEEVKDEYFHKGVNHQLGKITNKALPEKDYQNIQQLRQGISRSILSAINQVEKDHKTKIPFKPSLMKRISTKTMRLAERYSYYENNQLKSQLKQQRKKIKDRIEELEKLIKQFKVQEEFQGEGLKKWDIACCMFAIKELEALLQAKVQ